LDEVAIAATDDRDDLYLGDDEYKGCQDNSLIFDFAKEMAWQRYNNTDGDLIVGSRAFYPSLDQYFGLEGSLLHPMVLVTFKFLVDRYAIESADCWRVIEC
jgi:hypothetical protein